MDYPGVNRHHVLSSWKEIASYLGKGVRTAQRWERELGLPVRRPSLDHHVVIALTAELDQWILRAAVPTVVVVDSDHPELRAAYRRIAEMRREIAHLESQLRLLVGGVPIGSS